MRDFRIASKQTVACLIIGLILLCSGGFFYQSPEKTDKIYSEALADYNAGNYQNSYYLFSKISFFSPLKSAAVYHQGECARMLEDKKSAIKQYRFLYNNYKRNPLNTRARYLAGEQLIDVDAASARKCFENIIKKSPNTEYAIASQYYLGVLVYNKYFDENGKLKQNIPASDRNYIEKSFRHYIKTAPSGRHAFNAVKKWENLGGDINKDDYLLMANTAYMFADYEKAANLLQKVEPAEGWTLMVKNFNALNRYPQVRYYTEYGLKNYSKYPKAEDIEEVIDIYLKIQPDKTDALNKLVALSPFKGADYIMKLKCSSLPANERFGCFNSMYLKYPQGKYAPDALSNIYFAKIKSHDYAAAKKIGNDYLNKYADTKDAPLVMFWLGKISEKTENYDIYSKYYKSVISRYPDSYYAYRAYLKLNHYNNPLILNNIHPAAVVYPYKYANKTLIVKLVELNDYEVVNELCRDDNFIKSWVYYQKGEYPQSVILARNAMEKLKDKPDKYDLRWRLVYPIHYYEEITKYAAPFANNVPLMLSIIKEESHFDPLAQSSVGASGLMQLMPSTATEIVSRREGLSSDLFSIENNIKLGNIYYAQLRALLSGFDVSAVAAYNGGVGMVNFWKSSLYYNDTDEFVEQIPYVETKNYVKKVFKSYWNYIRIYQEQ